MQSGWQKLRQSSAEKRVWQRGVGPVSPDAVGVEE